MIDILNFFFTIFIENKLALSCESFAWQAIHVKCRNLNYEKEKKYIYIDWGIKG